MNKYLVKIAEVSEKLKEVDSARLIGRAISYGIPMAALGKVLTPGANKYKSIIAAGTGLAVGGYSGAKTSLRNQLREQQLHDIKLEGARQREELHQAKMQKYAELSEKEKEILKDVAGTGVIAGLGGAGTLAATRLAGTNPSTKKVLAIGTGIGLAADYVGLQANKFLNKKIEDHL